MTHIHVSTYPRIRVYSSEKKTRLPHCVSSYPRIHSEINLETKRDFLTAYPRIRVSAYPAERYTSIRNRTSSLRIRVSYSEIHLEKKHDFLTAYPRIRVSSSEIYLEKKDDFFTAYLRIQFRDTFRKWQGILQLLRKLLLTNVRGS